jgi:hypothetical protein
VGESILAKLTISTNTSPNKGKKADRIQQVIHLIRVIYRVASLLLLLSIPLPLKVAHIILSRGGCLGFSLTSRVPVRLNLLWFFLPKMLGKPGCGLFKQKYTQQI